MGSIRVYDHIWDLLREELGPSPLSGLGGVVGPTSARSSTPEDSSKASRSYNLPPRGKSAGQFIEKVPASSLLSQPQTLFRKNFIGESGTQFN
ncbi:hypothetical protein Ddc_11086 [Ditylenchus destructor]|nr:hypothetical protein Ddc_11086 [Ditylenchus destructor]